MSGQDQLEKQYWQDMEYDPLTTLSQSSWESNEDFELTTIVNQINDLLKGVQDLASRRLKELDER